ncbi:MAG: polysaccharide biosynthesis/export family protein [Muribaculaceae bacterium]|nr:polysaccharide biosynthesis/export family protein [Muribaculaceae bacterium]MDE5857131.1 polysaccharide biosynthesis/export family protein [Muribaculaceae bacterium]MDE7369156.1 polysaccharide biosynthesis/export family protein [Muribaculaceae bacterium]
MARFGCLIAIIILMSACSTSRSSLTYFEDIDSRVAEFQTDTANLVIAPHDELMISVTSFVPEATAQYNLPPTNLSTSENPQISTTYAMSTYIVNTHGYIDIPSVGPIKVEGMTTNQLTDSLVAIISKEVVEPNVRVQLVNFSVNVIGEVRNPGRFKVNNQRISILDAIAMAGDLTEYGKRDDIILIRESEGKRTVHKLNLNSADILDSPYFYLRQNDVVYIEPNKIRKDNSKYNQNNAFKLSVTSTIVSAVSVIASLVIALTVK